MLVSDIMTLDPACCTADCTAQEAARRMRQWSMGVLPVVEDEDARRVIGIVTDRDLCLGVVAEGRVPAHITVGDCMARAVVCCEAGQPVLTALLQMRDFHVRRLPVVDSARCLVGIISLTDIIRYAALPETEVIGAVARIGDPVGLRKARDDAEQIAIKR